MNTARKQKHKRIIKNYSKVKNTEGHFQQTNSEKKLKK